MLPLQGPLEGLIVLDLARGYPGAYSTLFLADFGADVIRVDPPPARPVPPEAAIRDGAYGIVHRNKRSVIINLQDPRGKEFFLRLASKADVLLEGFRPGVMKRLGVDYETLRLLNERLIYCSESGFGQSGPYVQKAGHDMNYIAMAGVLALIGEKNGQVYFPSNLVADMAGAGLHGTIGILLALAAREKTGKGQYVDISYLDATISLMAYEASRYFATGVAPKRGEAQYTGALPWVAAYRCKDGEYFTVAPIEPHLYMNFCRALGREDLVDKQRTTPEENERIKAELAAIFLTRTRDEWTAFFKNVDTCVGPVMYLNETFADPQVLHRKMLVQVDHPQLGAIKQTGLAIRLSETPGQIRTTGVPSGANTREIMKTFGYTEAEISGAIEGGAVGVAAGA
jgi:crotonobetainyl-CoA:carnitine CoA-transferase CaiB-like acyl-CoA transferase